MAPNLVACGCEPAGLRTLREWIHLEARGGLEFVDITERVQDVVLRSGIAFGLVNVQTRHTTTAILVNENEPLLLDDFADLLRRTAPRDAQYRHDRLELRTVGVLPEERQNGHSHARALLLGCSETLNVAAGRLDLGRWQRIFFVELDGARPRTVSVLALGVTAAPAEVLPLDLPALRAGGLP